MKSQIGIELKDLKPATVDDIRRYYERLGCTVHSIEKTGDQEFKVHVTIPQALESIIVEVDDVRR